MNVRVAGMGYDRMDGCADGITPQWTRRGNVLNLASQKEGLPGPERFNEPH